MYSDFSRKEESPEISKTLLQIGRKKEFLGSTIPPHNLGGQMKLNSDNSSGPPVGLLKTLPLPELEDRLKDLEIRAKEKEETRLEKEKERKYSIDELDFEGALDVPEVPVDEPLFSYGFLFPSRIVEPMEKLHTKMEKKDIPSKVMEIAELPVDPNFAVEMEIISKKPVENRMNNDSDIYEEESEYKTRKDSQGRTVKLRMVNLGNGNTPEPQISSLLTLNELKSRARSLAFSQFKIAKREQTKKLLNNQSRKLWVLMIVVRFYLKLKRLARSHKSIKEETTSKGSNRKKPSYSHKSTKDLYGSMEKKLFSNENLHTASDFKGKKYHILDTIVENTQLSQDFGNTRELPESTINGNQFDRVYLDVDGLKQFLDTLNNLNLLQSSFSSNRGVKKSKKKSKSQARKVDKLQNALYQSTQISKKRTRQLQKTALKKSLNLDS